MGATTLAALAAAVPGEALASHTDKLAAVAVGTFCLCLGLIGGNTGMATISNCLPFPDSLSDVSEVLCYSSPLPHCCSQQTNYPTRVLFRWQGWVTPTRVCAQLCWRRLMGWCARRHCQRGRSQVGDLANQCRLKPLHQYLFCSSQPHFLKYIRRIGSQPQLLKWLMPPRDILMT